MVDWGAVHDQDFMAFHEFSWFSQHVQLIFDIGANSGQSVRSFSSVLPGKKIHCFEANPSHFPLLDALHGEIQNLTIHHFGLGAKDGELSFYIPVCGGVKYLEEASTRLDYFEKPWVKIKFIERGGVKLDKLAVQIRTGDNLGLRPNLIKIDVEGAELDVIKGLRSTIETSRPVFLIENSDFANVTRYLAELGYEAIQYDETEGKFTRQITEKTNSFYFHCDHVNEIFASKKRSENVQPMSAPLASADFQRFEFAYSKQKNEMPHGQSRPYEVRLKNRSTATITSKGQADGKFAIFVSYHWLTEKGEAVIWDNTRSPLPGELKPGEEVSVSINVAAPKNPGTYILEVDVVQEGVTWFRDKGVKPLHYKIAVR